MIGFSFIYFYKKQKVFFPRRAACFEYLSQTTLENWVDIDTQVKKVGTTSLTLEHFFYKKDSEDGPRTFVAKAEITEVAYSEELHSKVPLPEELVAALRICMQS
jgi:acyl-CoA thioesterase FadM